MNRNLSSKPFLTVKTIGFGEQDQIKFEALLTIAENRLHFPWKLTQAAESDFYLLASDLKLLLDKDELLKSLPRQRCIFYTEEITDGRYHEILASKDNIPHIRSLVELLNKLSSSTASIETQIRHRSSAQKDTLPESEYFDSDEGFLGLILSSKEYIREYRHISPASTIKLYIDPENKAYYCHSCLEDLEVFFAADANILKRDLSRQQLQEIVANEAFKSRPLSNLIWHGVFISSKGRIIRGHNKEKDIVHLKRWPDINLPSSRKLIKLAAYMQSNSVDLSTISQQTNTPIDQIHNFFNACKVIGLIEYCATPSIYSKNLDNNQRQLYEKIIKRLN